MLFANIINAIIWLVILGFAWWIVTQIPGLAPLNTIIRVLFIIAAVLVLLSCFGVMNVGVPRLYRG